MIVFYAGLISLVVVIMIIILSYFLASRSSTSELKSTIKGSLIFTKAFSCTPPFSKGAGGIL
ncbi:MAG: hypothetical protein IEMM0008_1266 [bacterium]|nr:MAG: hypothetical protein IEMM0008_1266 [bacterium]